MLNPKDVIFIEEKEIATQNGIQLGKYSDSPKLGAQLSHDWIINNLNELYKITTGSEIFFIEYCGKNYSNLPRMVAAVKDITFYSKLILTIIFVMR